MTQDEAQALESKVLFALAHPAARTDRGTLARLFGTPDPLRQVLDYGNGGERVLLATLVRGGRGTNDASYLLVLGCRSPLDAGAVAGFLDEAEARARPGEGEEDRALEIVLPPPIAWMRPLLKGRGYSDVYSYLTLVAEVPPAAEADDADWRDVDTSNVDTAYACYRDAFLETSSPVSSPEEFRAALLNADPRPRVLLAEGEAAAVQRVAWRDEAASRAQLRFICRHVRRRGQRVGDRAISETFRVARRMGATSVQLDVASTNRAGIALYDRWGFRRVDEEAVLRLVLGVERPGAVVRAKAAP